MRKELYSKFFIFIGFNRFPSEYQFGSGIGLIETKAGKKGAFIEDKTLIVDIREGKCGEEEKECKKDFFHKVCSRIQDDENFTVSVKESSSLDYIRRGKTKILLW